MLYISLEIFEPPNLDPRRSGCQFLSVMRPIRSDTGEFIPGAKGALQLSALKQRVIE